MSTNGTPALDAQSRAIVDTLEHRLVGDILPALAQNYIRPQIDGLKQIAAHVVRGEATSLSDEVLTALAKGLVPFLNERLAEVTAPLIARIDALEQRKGIAPLAARIAQLEQKPGLKYQGVWAAEKVYSVGDFVTDHGSLWHAWDGNVGVRPGSSETWQLAVQRGRDAKGKR